MMTEWTIAKSSWVTVVSAHSFTIRRRTIRCFHQTQITPRLLFPSRTGGGASLYAPWRRCTPRWFRDLVATTTRQELQKNQCFLSWMCPPGYWDALPDKSWDSRRTWWGWNGVGVWSATAEGTEQWVIEIEWDWMEISGGVEQQHELMQFNILLPF